MPNCRVSKGTRITAKIGTFAGQEMVVRSAIDPIAGESRGCTVVIADRPGKTDLVTFGRDDFIVVRPRRPEGCVP